MKSILLEVLQVQLTLHAAVQFQDVCKLLYQAAFGCEHLTFQVESVEDSLRKEFHDPPPFAGEEPLIERIDPTHVVCRVNLRPYKATGGAYEPLRAAFVQSMERMENGRQRFRTLWDAFSGLASARALPYCAAEVERFRARHLAGDSLPAFHHSEAYRAANKPCYRVLRVASLPPALAKEAG